jgi:hypothetical protein
MNNTLTTVGALDGILVMIVVLIIMLIPSIKAANEYKLDGILRVDKLFQILVGIMLIILIPLMISLTILYTERINILLNITYDNNISLPDSFQKDIEEIKIERFKRNLK